jgi:hypothetical protein
MLDQANARINTAIRERDKVAERLENQ